MSDFLGNLMARNTGAAQGIRPYLPSRFEPAAAPAGSGLMEMLEEQPAAAAQAPAPQSPASPAEPALARPEVSAPAGSEARRPEFPEESRDRGTGRLSPADHDLPAREPAALARPDLPATDPAALARNPDPVIRERVTERPIFIERIVAEPRPFSKPEPVTGISDSFVPEAPRLRQLEPPRPTTLLIVDPKVEPPTFPEQSHRTMPAGEGGSPFEPAATTHGQSSVKITSVPSRRIAGERQPQLAQSAGTRSDPDIHVTIGRVEIRATTAAQAPAARRNGHQPMSLDEYQRRRTSGGER